MSRHIKLIISNIGNIVVAFVLLLLGVAALRPDWKASIRAYVNPPFRTIVAIATADLEGKGSLNKILKVKTQEGLFIEIYGTRVHPQFGPQLELLSYVKLPDKKDGYFTFAGKVTNLAIDDINDDSIPEILTTSFDQDLVSRLNVYQYIPGDKTLAVVQLEQSTGI